MIADRPPGEDEPTEGGDAGEHRGNRVTKHGGDRDGAAECNEVRHDVVERGNESLIHDMGHSYQDTTGKEQLPSAGLLNAPRCARTAAAGQGRDFRLGLLQDVECDAIGVGGRTEARSDIVV